MLCGTADALSIREDKRSVGLLPSRLQSPGIKGLYPAAFVAVFGMQNLLKPDAVCAFPLAAGGCHHMSRWLAAEQPEAPQPHHGRKAMTGLAYVPGAPRT